ncbi:nucleoside deaminase [Georgenia muralis]|uniref:tRNA(Arg) A34 adenosine deaminase TadA n=1 Tax=Georgenia muralis TaxID=154117 RepID=A0A3N4ZRE2_9MICO|nr:nucleoside deaminase [Georgenia muralis]RPF28098.1 tRNA(Arg) A34 adenosine deaminase TadA [Georgenia muralis]
MTTTRSAELTPQDEAHLRTALRVAVEAKAAGKHPFGAIVVDGDGRVVASRGNNALLPDGDPTQHAELLALSDAARAIGPDGMGHATLFTSAEPCVMCTGAGYWTGVGRIVYALSEVRLLELTGAHPENPTFSFPCREVLARGQREVAVSGPHLEDEAAEPHVGFWV